MDHKLNCKERMIVDLQNYLPELSRDAVREILTNLQFNEKAALESAMETLKQNERFRIELFRLPAGIQQSDIEMLLKSAGIQSHPPIIEWPSQGRSYCYLNFSNRNDLEDMRLGLLRIGFPYARSPFHTQFGLLRGKCDHLTFCPPWKEIDCPIVSCVKFFFESNLK